MIRLKSGVSLARLQVGGIRLVEGLKVLSRVYYRDLTITAGDDSHPPTDPHTLGRALDVRSHDLPPDVKAQFAERWARTLMADLADTPHPIAIPHAPSGGWVTTHFFVFLEAEGTTNEHFHAQVRNGTAYDLTDYLSDEYRPWVELYTGPSSAVVS